MGIIFSVNLSEIPHLNYSIALEKARCIAKQWKTRWLTPIGRIVLIKTLILPQFNHLFLSLITPKLILDKINRLFFECLWNGKPDKIRREVVFKHNISGGLKMVNVYYFENALKLSWIKKLFNQEFSTASSWYKLLLFTAGNLKNLKILGGNWSSLVCQKIQNPFWKHVSTQWVNFCTKQKPETTQDVLKNCLWFNDHISKEPLFIKNWNSKGIKIVADLVDNFGNVLPPEEISRLYSIQLNLFDYYRIRGLLQKFIEKYTKEKNFLVIRPYILSHIKILIKKEKGSRPFYIEQIKYYQIMSQYAQRFGEGH